MKLKNLIASLVLLMIPQVAQAQNSPYQAAVSVNGVGVTYYEIDQRALMLAVLGTLGDVDKLAREALIDGRLQHQAAKALGISVTEEVLKAGLEEFAQRANLTPDQMIAEFQKEGVEPETFLDFVRAGLEWRLVIQQKFQAKAFISEAELDAALAFGTTSVGASVLLSELVLPLPPGQEAQSMELASELSKRLRTAAEFEEAVLTYSASPSRANGGKMDWVPITNLPADIGTLILTMGAGSVTKPIQLPNSVAIFYVRGIRDDRTAASRTIAYDYATYLIPGGQSAEAMAQAANLKASVDTCKDLAAVVRHQPADRFSREIVPVRKVPRDIALELARLDANEVSTSLTRGANGPMVFLMLCSRTTELTAGNREEVRNALFAQRMEAFGAGYLQELRGDAIIVDK